MSIEPDPGNGLEVVSAAQCQHIRAIADERLAEPVGNVGPEVLSQMRDILADLLDTRRTAEKLAVTTRAWRLMWHRRITCRADRGVGHLLAEFG